MLSYLELLNEVLHDGEAHADRTGVGTRSCFGMSWRHDMREGFPLLTTKHVPPRLPFIELKWILSGSTSVSDLHKENVHYWDEWATAEKCAKFNRHAGQLGPTYGHAWRNFGGYHGMGTDQVWLLLQGLKDSPFSRRHILNAWHPQEAQLVELPPCHTMHQVKCHGDKGISLSVWCRSIDIFLGLPFDILIYAYWLEILAVLTGREAWNLVFQIGDLHLYNSHVRQAEEQLKRDPYDLPTVDVGLAKECRYLDVSQQLHVLKRLDWASVTVDGYVHHPKLTAPVAV